MVHPAEEFSKKSNCGTSMNSFSILAVIISSYLSGNATEIPPAIASMTLPWIPPEYLYRFYQESEKTRYFFMNSTRYFFQGNSVRIPPRVSDGVSLEIFVDILPDFS